MSLMMSNPVACDDGDATNDIRMVAENSSSARPNHRCCRRNSRMLSKVVSAGRFGGCVVVAVQETSKGLLGAADVEGAVVSADYSANSVVG